MAANPLQGREHLGNDVAALLQEDAQRLLAIVQLGKARFRLLDPIFHRGYPRGRIQNLLVELAAVVPNELDLSLELCLLFQGFSLLGAERLEFLVALLETVEARGRCEIQRRRKVHWRREATVLLRRRGNGLLRERSLRPDRE